MTTKPPSAARSGVLRLPEISVTWAQLTLAASSLLLVLMLAVWSSGWERQQALEDFEHELGVMSEAVGANFEHLLQLHQVGRRGPDEHALVDATLSALLHGAQRLQVPGSVLILVARPGEQGFLTTDQRLIPSKRLRRALDQGLSTVSLPRDEAISFGLPPRQAIAGLERVAFGESGPWGVVVLASTARFKTRELHERWRLGLTAGCVLLLAAGFFMVAQSRQRRELELARELAVSRLEGEKETLLAQADKMAAIAALGTGIAHEIGTPLAVIVGRVDQVMARSDDARIRDGLAIVLEQVERIQRIVRGCLALVRGDAPHLSHSPAGEVAKRAIELIRHRFSRAEIDLVCEVEPDLPTIACEPSLLEQALVNVLLNACQATEGGGRVSLRATRDATHVLFVVEDEGSGIPDELAARVIEPFFSTRRSEGGTGLGLTIAREIVAHHAGTLTLARRSDARGTRATIAVRI